MSGLLTACGQPYQSTSSDDIVVEIVNAEHHVQFAERGTALSSVELDKLSGFLGNVQPISTQKVLLEAAPAPTINGERVKQVRGWLMGQGISPDRVLAQATPNMDKNMVKITLAYAVASVPECTDWALNADNPNYNNGTLSNHGCAVTKTLARQVADPADFKRGTGNTRINNERMSIQYDRYRQMQTEAAPASNSVGSQ